MVVVVVVVIAVIVIIDVDVFVIVVVLNVDIVVEATLKVMEVEFWWRGGVGGCVKTHFRVKPNSVELS